MSNSSSTPQVERTRSDLGPERLAMAVSRRPPGLWTDVEVDAELRRSRQLIRAFAAQDAVLACDGDRLGPAYARSPAPVKHESGCGDGSVSEYETYRLQLVRKKHEPNEKTGPDSLGGEAAAAVRSAVLSDPAALVPLALGALVLGLGLAVLSVVLLLRLSV